MSVVVGLTIRSRIQSLTVLESEYNKSSEEDNGSGAGLLSRARMPLKLSPRKKGVARIPPTLADTTSRPACHALRRRTHGGRSKGLTPTTKYTKRKRNHKNMKDNHQPNFKGSTHFIALLHAAHARALVFWREAPPFSPRSHSYRESISSSSSCETTNTRMVVRLQSNIYETNSARALFASAS